MTMRMKHHAKALFAAAVLSMLLWAPGAQGATATIHPPLSTPPGPSFDGSGTPAGSFQPQAMAVDPSNGDIYVVDVANKVLLRFDATGTVDASFGTGGALDGSSAPAGSFAFSNGGLAANAVAIDRSGTATDGNIYLADPPLGVVYVFDETGAYQGRLFGSSIPSGPFGTPDGLVVDQANGDLYIADATKNLVYRFDPAAAVPAEGDYDSQISDPEISTPAGLAIDSAGNLYVANYRGFVSRYVGGAHAAYVDFGEARAIALDPSDDHIYIDNGSYASHYNAASEGNEFRSSPGQGQIADSLGIAVDASSNVYISDQGQGKVFVFAPGASVETPTVSIDPASSITPTSVQLSGTVNPNGTEEANDTTWRFEYSTDQANWSQSAGGTVPATTTGTPISEEITGLKPNGQYFARLVAENAASPLAGGSTYSDTIEFKTPPLPEIAPAISGGGAFEVGPTSALLKADLNPGGGATTYRFEYGPTTAYGQSAPVPAGQLGADGSPHQVSAQVTGLAPETRYHWRLVAENSVETVAGADHTFTTLATHAAVQLPDNRAWEQVTPADKNGGDLGNLFFQNRKVPGLSETISGTEVRGGAAIQSSENGDRISFITSLSAFANPGGAKAQLGNYLSERSAEGWRTRNIDPPYAPAEALFSNPVFMSFDDSLSKVVHLRPFDQTSFAADAPKGVDGYYVHDLDDGSFRFLWGFAQQGNVRSSFAADALASEDFSHVVQRYDVGPKFIGTAEGTFVGQPFGLYERYETGDGSFDTRMASILPDGTPVDGDLGGGDYGPNENALSRDGARIVFEALAVGCPAGAETMQVQGFTCGPGPAPQLYMRENGTATRWISDYAPGVPLDPEAGPMQHYWGADPDVEHVFFTSQTRLTADSTASHDGGDGFTTGSHGDLYRYDVEANGGAGELIDITVDDSRPEGAQVIGVLGNSENGERIYFAARSNQLDGEQGVAGQANLYLWDNNGGSPTTTYIATLRAPDGSPEGDDRANWVNVTYERSSEVTPSGDILFTSKNQLTGFDNAGHNQVYVYDVEGERLTCASCFGEEPATRDAFVPHARMMTMPSASIHHHSLSGDGRWAFFNTRASLVARDTNGQIDAYRFDAASGRVALLSSGQSSKPSYFQGASPDGEDAFFITHERLVQSDVDGNADIYDARVNGGIASQSRTPVVPCEGDACQPPPVIPDDPTPSSTSFIGPGNKQAKKSGKKAHRKKACGKKAAAKRRGHGKQCRAGKSTRRHG